MYLGYLVPQDQLNKQANWALDIEGLNNIANSLKKLDRSNLNEQQKKLINLLLLDRFLEGNPYLSDLLFVIKFGKDHQEDIPKTSGLSEVVMNICQHNLFILDNVDKCKKIAGKLPDGEKLFAVLKSLTNSDFDFDKIDIEQARILAAAYMKYIQNHPCEESSGESNSLLMGTYYDELPELEESNKNKKRVIKLLQFTNSDIVKYLNQSCCLYC